MTLDEKHNKYITWQKYILQIFINKHHPEQPNLGPEIIVNEVRHAVNLAKNGKSHRCNTSRNSQSNGKYVC